MINKEPVDYNPKAININWFDILEWFQDHKLPCPDIFNESTAKSAVNLFINKTNKKINGTERT